MTHPAGQHPTIQPPRTEPGPPPAPGRPAAKHHRLAITAQAPGERSTVTLDGNDIARALTGLTFTVGVGQVPTATLDLLLIDITEIQDAETRILVPETTRETLIALGWIPPAEPEPTDDLRLTPYLVIHRYRTDHGTWAWSWDCEGDGTCEGHRALDFTTRAHAEANASAHLAAEHPDVAPVTEG